MKPKNELEVFYYLALVRCLNKSIAQNKPKKLPIWKEKKGLVRFDQKGSACWIKCKMFDISIDMSLS